jgi:DNA ligase D-like protein (predicted ligase)
MNRLDEVAPMLATHGLVATLKTSQWAFEGKWDGYRMMIETDHGALRLRLRTGRDVTDEYPQLHALAADLGDHHVVLDGEVVGLDEFGVPRFSEMQNRSPDRRVEFWAFDLLYLDGKSLLRVKYSDRRKLLETLAILASSLIVPERLPGNGIQALEYSAEHGWEGVVAKRLDSHYQPGRRSTSWIKHKHWKTQEVVIGGWRRGEGWRTNGIGSLLMGIPSPAGLHYVGRVGTGFTDRQLVNLKTKLEPLHADESPFDAELPDAIDGVTFVQPLVVGEVRYTEWTPDHRLRQPTWCRLRPDKKPGDVIAE